MGVENQIGIKGKPDSRWHASHTTMMVGGIAALFTGASLLVPDPQLKRNLAAAALMGGAYEGLFLVGDAIFGSARNKLKGVTGKKRSSG